MGTRGMRWVQGVRGGYEGYEVGMRAQGGYEVGTRGMRWVRGGYEGYEVGTRGMRWVRGV